MKNKFGFILVKTQLGENIGACARSMKNFGFSKLHIVSPKINFPNHRVNDEETFPLRIMTQQHVPLPPLFFSYC